MTPRRRQVLHLCGLASIGSIAVVGARGDEDPNGEAAGTAYVFTL